MTREEFFKEFPEVVIYDFEVFPCYWLLTIIDAANPQGAFIENIPALKAAYDERSGYVWAGYNSGHYDRFILGALYKSGISKNDLYKLSRALVSGQRDKKQWRYLIDGMKSYDIASYAMIGGVPKYSLKQLEAFMGHDIAESSIPWDYPEAFTKEQKEATRRYCLHDVEQTFEVLLRSIADFTAHADIISTFGLDPKAWSMTKAQLTAEVLQCSKTAVETVEDNGVLYDVEKELDFSGDEWNNFILPCVCVQKYPQILDFYLDADNYRPVKDPQTGKILKTGGTCNVNIMGVPHVLALGGIHGALKRYHQAGGNMLHIDVTSYYPSLMIEWDLLTRRSQHPELFREIYDKRIALKKAGKKREQQPYKIILNSTFGISNDKYSKAYDPCKNHEVCINGQLLLVMLLERLEGHCKLIQSNTDGIIISYAGYDRDAVIEICKGWEAETRMKLDYDEIDEIWQKDVNNYLVRYGSGSYEAKGSYVKFDSDLDRDMAIIRTAVRSGLIEGSEDAIRNCIEQCSDLGQFQKIIKLGSSYKYAYIGDQELTGHRCFRVFAVKDGATLRKQKTEGGTKEKVANTPESACIVYGDLNSPVLEDTGGRAFNLDRLDREYYIETALKQYAEMLPAE